MGAGHGRVDAHAVGAVARALDRRPGARDRAWRGVPAARRRPGCSTASPCCTPCSLVLADVLTPSLSCLSARAADSLLSLAPVSPRPGARRRRARRPASSSIRRGRALVRRGRPADGAGLRPFPGLPRSGCATGRWRCAPPTSPCGYVLPAGARSGPWYTDDDGWAGVGDRGRLGADGALEIAGRGGTRSPSAVSGPAGGRGARARRVSRACSRWPAWGEPDAAARAAAAAVVRSDLPTGERAGPASEACGRPARRPAGGARPSCATRSSTTCPGRRRASPTWAGWPSCWAAPTWRSGGSGHRRGPAP